MSNSSPHDWQSRYEASLVEQDRDLTEGGYDPWSGATVSFAASTVGGFVAAVYWMFTSDNRGLTALMAGVLGATIMVLVVVFARSRSLKEREEHPPARPNRSQRKQVPVSTPKHSDLYS